MTTVHTPTPTLKRHSSATHCALCRRALKPGAVIVPGLGIVGPDCERHAAGLQLYLQRRGLGALMTEAGVQVQGRVHDGVFTCAGEMRALRDRAESAGVSLTCEHQRADDGTFTFTYHAKPGELLYRLALRAGREARAQEVRAAQPTSPTVEDMTAELFASLPEPERRVLMERWL